MRNPLRWVDASWRNCICFTLAGAIFVLSQFVAMTPPLRDGGKVVRTMATAPADSTHDTEAD